MKEGQCAADRNVKSRVVPMFPEITLGKPYNDLGGQKMTQFCRRPGRVTIGSQ